MQILIRQAAIKDVADLAVLTGQLGYEMSTVQTEESLKNILAHKDHDVFVALDNNKIIGWIGLFYSIQMESSPFCEIRGLVVDENYRGNGAGKMLIEKAKQWAKERGLSKLRLRTNVKRTETHLFYQHLGFREMKQQKALEMDI